MATDKVVADTQKLDSCGSAGTEDSVQVRIIQVPAKCRPITIVASKSESVTVPHKVISRGQTYQPAPSTITPSSLLVVSKPTTPEGVSLTSQQAAKQTVGRVTSLNQVSTPGRTVVITVPRSAAPQPVARSLPQATSPQIPGNVQIPPGMMLLRSDSGQLMLVSQQALAQAQQGSRIVSGQAPRIPTPQVSAAAGIQNKEKVTVIRMAAPSTFQMAPLQKTAVVIPAVVPSHSTVSDRGDHPHVSTTVTKKEPLKTFSQETLESVKKCKNFLVTLIKLASSDSRSVNMAANVRRLVRNLLEGKIEAEEFTEQLYDELKSTPQPCLVPFLKKSLPAVRLLTEDPQLFIQQATVSASNPTTVSSSKKQSLPEAGDSAKTSQQQAPGLALRPGLMTVAQHRNCISIKSGPTLKHTSVQSRKHTPGTFSGKHAVPQDSTHSTRPSFKEASGCYKEDDDINDVASMAGVNLREENARILTTAVGSVVQSCQDQLFLSPPLMLSRVLHTGRALGVTDVGPEVVALVSHATQERLRGLIEKLTVVVKHRKLALKQEDEWCTKVSDVRSQLRFLEEIERLKKKRRDEEEREALLRLARSRSNTEDPQLQQLKQRAKELQQMEEAQLQQREANLTALAAIGPRKKRAFDQTENQVSLLPRQDVQRTTRVMLKDLLTCMEQEPFLRRSLTFYKGMLS